MLLALLLAAAPPLADVHLSVVAGMGTAYGYAGAHVELAFARVAVVAGFGIFQRLAGDAEWITGRYASRPGLPVALGLRYSLRHALFLAATGCSIGYTDMDDYRTLNGNRVTATVTAGWRENFGDHLFGELALGGGIAKVVDQGFSDYNGKITPPRDDVVLQPDAAVALGARF